ncbi:MAG: DPP IV N-terminal domain-containing protein [Spirosomataceae bacterium]
MRKLQLLSFLLVNFAAWSQQDNGKKLTTTDYEQAVKFLGFNTNKLVYNSSVSPVWLADGRFWYANTTPTGREFVLINPKDGSRKSAPALKTLLPEAVDDKAPTPQGRRGGGSPEVLSPDGKRAAFIRDWNLWIKDVATGKETQLTTDGIKDFGYATDNAGWKHSDRAILLWSPDSRKIATFQQDQRHVSDMYLVTTNVGAPTLEAWKYPLPEDKEIIKIHRVIVEVDPVKVIRLNIPADPRRGTLCDDIACSGSFDDNEWSADASQLAFVTSSRDHKEAKMRIANATTGNVREVFEERVATQYESGRGKTNWHFLPATNEIIWYSERDDWGHLYLYDATTGQLKSQMTKGDFVVTRLLKIDEKNRVLYFEANGRETGRDPILPIFIG